MTVETILSRKGTDVLEDLESETNVLRDAYMATR